MTRAARAARSRMMNPDQATREAAQTLDRRLNTAERGNYIGLRIVRDPGPRPAFQFRRNAAATLAKYTRDPRFTWREDGIPASELQPVFDDWWKRFELFRLVGGGAVYEFDGVVRFDVNIDEAGYRKIAAREYWMLPKRLELRFSPPRNMRSIDPAPDRSLRLASQLATRVRTGKLVSRPVGFDTSTWPLVTDGFKRQPVIATKFGIDISRKRPALDEPRSLVQRPRRGVRYVRSRLQAQPCISPRPRLGDHVIQRHRGNAAPQSPRRRAHRFQLAVSLVELLQRHHPEQVAFLPQGPQRHRRITQPTEIECENHFRRRIFERRTQMQFDQRDDRRMRQIIGNDPPPRRKLAQVRVSPDSTPHKCTASTKPPRPRTSK